MQSGDRIYVIQVDNLGSRYKKVKRYGIFVREINNRDKTSDKRTAMVKFDGNKGISKVSYDELITDVPT